jgi:beta-glucosidase
MSFIDALTNGRLRFLNQNVLIPEARGTQDFIGVNYYTATQISFQPFKAGDLFMRHAFAKDAVLSETGFIANEPQGLFDFIRSLQAYHLPVIITENGVEDPNDRLRPRYLIEHLHQVWRALNFNWPVKGYFHWSLVDNFEWERGWTQRFGLWGLDNTTQARIRRPSVDLYGGICKENAISSVLVDRYAPAAFEKLFPG